MAMDDNHQYKLPNFKIEEKESIVNISTDKISKAVEEVRKGLCNAVKTGHFKMWFKATAKGGFIVAETSGEAGLEIEFDCKLEKG